jgi:hypothetical protein
MDWTSALGAVAIATGAGGIGVALLAVKHAQREADTELEDALKVARHEHEECARMLHQWRIRHPDELDP